MPLHPDWKEFLELLNSHDVEYLVVGAGQLTSDKLVAGRPRDLADLLE